MFFIFLLGMFSDTPLVVGNKTIDANSAQKSKQFAKRFFDTLSTSEFNVELSISQQELAGMTAITNRTIPQLATQAAMSPNGLNIEATYDTGLPDGIRFINFGGNILPSGNGLKIGGVQLGSWQIDGAILLALLEKGLNFSYDESLGSELISSVQKVNFTEQKGQVAIEMPGKLLEEKTQKPSQLLALRDMLAPFGDSSRIRTYYQHLTAFADSQSAPRELAAYVRQVFKLAGQRSAEKGLLAVSRENQAALLALVVYFGSDKFELMIGNISEPTRKAGYKRYRHRSKSTLQGRVDLQKHFVYSIALQIFGSMQASDALGEFKELLDVNPGGSGFSFADLMADRAGTRLAKIATFSHPDARLLQALLQEVTDEQLLPDIQGLPEGLSEEQFKRQYSDVDAKPYLAMVDEIDNRIQSLPLYRSSDS